MAAQDRSSTFVDIITDTAVWLIDETSQFLLQAGRWASETFVEALDWVSQKTVAGLRLSAQTTEWAIANPWKAARDAGMVVLVVLAVLAAEIYIYDLVKRRRPSTEL